MSSRLAETGNVELQLKQMGGRIREIRNILNIAIIEMASITGISEEEYIAHENGEVDSSFTFLQRCAQRFGVDISALVSGESPKLSFYTMTRQGGGLPIKRREGFEYRHLAAQLKNRNAEPFTVRAKGQEADSPIVLSTHPGHEFDYILRGKLKVQMENNIEVLEEGDSIYYDSSHPHGMIAVDCDECEFLAIVINGDSEAVVAPDLQETAVKSVLPGKSRLLYHNFVDETLDENGYLKSFDFHHPANFNFAYDVLDVMAERCPDKLAMKWISRHRECRNFTFGDISRASSRAANYLTSLGIGKGDRVMLVMRRHYHFWTVINALHKIGAVAIPASNQLTTKDFVYRFESAGVKAIVAADDAHIIDCIDEAAVQYPELKARILVGEDIESRDNWSKLESNIDLYSDNFQRPADLKADDTMLIFFSSGTTGYPKMVEHSFTYPLGHIVTARWWQQVDPDGIHFTISDTGWGKALWGKIYGQWLCEAAVLTYDFDRFEAHDILTLFKEHQITTFCAPPTMFRFFIKDDLAKYDLSSLKNVCTAGEALNPEVFWQFYKATGLKMMEGFGQTETTLTLANLAGVNPKPGSMGKPTPQYDVRLIDADGNPVKPGETGEIVIFAEKNQVCGVFQGYRNAPELNASAWHDGIYHTGDTAWQDEDGFFWYVGRTDDVIKSSGYRIGPFEIESVIMELPYVLECAVIASPDEVRGQVVKAVIVLTKGTVGSDQMKKEIQEYVKSHTAPYKYPRKIDFVESLPKTTSGKIRRTELRAMELKNARK
ncbi:MAG: cupin domain-containing protein [Lentisphaerae bacterium]|nr:cupin domain-containing protein [Lentisphaerota bacterium]